MEQFKPFWQRIEDGEYTEIWGTARIGNGIKRHRAKKTINTATGRTHSIDIDGSCPIGSTRTRFAGRPNNWLSTETAPITCRHCDPSLNQSNPLTRPLSETEKYLDNLQKANELTNQVLDALEN